VFYKINFVKIQKSFIQTKTQFIKLNDLKKLLQHSYESFSTNFLDQHDIHVTNLHKYVWKK